MGNRVNYVFLPDESNAGEAVTVLYAHWVNNNGADELALAIEHAKSRWNDVSYSLRIIFDQLTKDGRDSETGYGLYSLKEYDPQAGMWNDNPDILISLSKQEVCIDGNWHSFNSFIEYHQEVKEFHNV